MQAFQILRPTSFGRSALTLGVAFGLASTATAQFGNEWLTLTADAAQPALAGLSSTSIEVDFAYGDLDADGFTDVVVARKQPVSTTGKRTNVLLMNASGTLVDETSTFATASDVPGDMGFMTATNDSDIALVDVNGDGELDVVTAPRRAIAGDPKALAHPRVYVNLGDNGSGAWLGLRNEDARIPQIFNLGGNPTNPNFTTVAAGDVDNDGDNDLYFGDATGGAQANDIGDRLFDNDGNGFFSDVTSATFPVGAVNIRFATKVDMADLNNDGALEILQDGGFGEGLFAHYNDGSNPGNFLSRTVIDDMTTYNFAVGDLNNDGRLDVTIGSNGNDGFRINQSTNADGTIQWSPKQTYTFLQNSDDGFSGQQEVVDMDMDGFADALVCDIDADLASFGRRFHLYHNQGTAPGGIPAMVEERELNVGGGWLGAVGLLNADLRDSFDVAAFDVDNDGDPDMLLGRRDGTTLWTNNTFVCQEDLGFGGPGDLSLSLCGPELVAGNTATLRIENGTPGAAGVIGVSAAVTPIPLLGGTVVTFPLVTTVPFGLDGSGSIEIPVAGGAAAPITVIAQAAAVDFTQPDLFEISNAIAADYQ